MDRGMFFCDTIYTVKKKKKLLNIVLGRVGGLAG